MKTIVRLILSCAILADTVPAFAHHSAAAYDTQKQVKISGTVMQYRFANPHVYLTLQVKKDDGSVSTVEVEAGAAAVLNGLGFTKDSRQSRRRRHHRRQPGARQAGRVCAGERALQE